MSRVILSLIAVLMLSAFASEANAFGRRPVNVQVAGAANVRVGAFGGVRVQSFNNAVPVVGVQSFGVQSFGVQSFGGCHSGVGVQSFGFGPRVLVLP